MLLYAKRNNVPWICVCYNFRNMFPENIVQENFHQIQTKYIAVKPKILKKNTSEILLAVANGSMSVMGPSVEHTPRMNVFGE